jgi:hypothetical protein
MVKRNSRRAATAIATLAVAVATVGAGAQAASTPSPGTFKGKLRGGTVSLKVKSSKRARLKYTLKSKCGRAHGTVSLKIKKGRFHTGPRSATVVRGKFTAGGERAKGTLTGRSGAGKRAGESCKTGSRRFTASLSSGSGRGASLKPSDYGHYTGANGVGRPVSFDVVGGSGGATIQNFAVDVDTECWGDYNGDGASDTLLVHIAGYGDDIKEDGSFDIYYAPDEDTEFEFTGTIAGGHVDIDVTVGGHFNPDGTPNLVGSHECDSWGDTYSAARAG